jgi:hypothetical protein
MKETGNKKTMMINPKTFYMKRLIIILTVTITACTNQVQTDLQESGSSIGQDQTEMTVPLNQGSKWKADEATKRNVAAMVQVVNDSSYEDATKRNQLTASLQTKIDSLIKQCSMKGKDHEALHTWLEKVLKDLKELKEEEDEYNQAYALLKKDVESFYTFFEGTSAIAGVLFFFLWKVQPNLQLLLF